MSNNRWTTGEVETLLGEMINISYQENEKGPNKTWTATDAENIAPYRAQQGIQEEVQAMTKSFYQSQQSNDEENQGFVAGGMDAESGNSDFYDGTDDDTAL